MFLYCVHVMLKNGDPIVEFNKISLVWKESQNYAKFRTEEFELDTCQNFLTKLFQVII